MSTDVQSTSLASGAGLSTQFTMLHGDRCDPVNARVVTYNGMARVDHDNFVVLVSGILVNPVRV